VPVKSCVLGALVDRVDMAGAVERIASFIKEGSPHHVITLNAEIIYRALDEHRLMAVINRADLVTPDGAGVVWAAKRLGQPVPERVAGIDLVQALFQRGKREGWRFFFYGAAPGVAKEAARRAAAAHPGLQVAGTAHGYLSPKDQLQLVEQIKEAKPHILLVALGAPKQEYWIKENMAALGVPVCIGVGGSLDVLAGKVKRAPKILQKLKLEWLYRLIANPRRTGRMLALPRFVLAVLRAKGNT